MSVHILCSACGKQNRSQARFCGYCGQPLSISVTQGEEAPRAPAPPPPVSASEAVLHELRETAQLLGDTLREAVRLGEQLVKLREAAERIDQLRAKLEGRSPEK